MPAATRSVTPGRSPRRRNLNPLKHEHIHPQDLPNLAQYRYSGSDLSILGNWLLQPYWSYVVTFVPMTVAPNFITLVGFIVSTSATAVITYYSLFLGVEPPGWVWMYAALTLFSYQTLDAIDGKHARRTGTGSPMGELFDHGCDAFFSPLCQMNICVALGLPAMQRFVVCAISAATLLFTIWEQFCTGTLDLGYINGPTEGILIGVAVFIFTGLYTPSFWWITLKDDGSAWIDLSTSLPQELSSLFGSALIISKPVDCLFVFVIVAALVTMLTNVLHVITRPSVHRREFYSFTVLLPTLVALASYVAVVIEFPRLVSEHPFVVETCFGLLASYTATRMTVARLCKTDYNPFSGYLIVSLLATTGSLLANFFAPELFISAVLPNLHWVYYLLAGFAVWQYGHLIVSVFSQISSFLKINILTMTEQQKKKSLEKGELPPAIVLKLRRALDSFFSS